MENTAMTTTTTEKMEGYTPEYIEALELHQSIMVNAELAATSILEMSKSLKRMRDGKLYVQLGHETFDEYVEQKVGFKSRQAYNYISVYERLGDKVLQSHANLGVTKLLVIAQLPLEEREEALENKDLAGMSVSQVKELLAKNKQNEEQLNLLSGQLSEAQKKAEDVEALRGQLDQMEGIVTEKDEELQKLREAKAPKPGKPTAAELKEIKEQERRKAEADAQKKISKAQEEAERRVKAAQAEADKKLAAARAEEAKKLEEAKKVAWDKAAEELEKKYKDNLEEMQAERSKAESRAQELEKKISVAGNPETLRFNFFFEELQTNLHQLTDSLNKVRGADEEMGNKLTGAMIKFMALMKTELGISQSI